MAVAAQLDSFRKFLDTGGLPELGPGPRPEVLTHDQLEPPLDRLLAQSSLTSTDRDLVRALILLWHDRLDAAHTIAQGIDNPDGSFIHAIVHRREPDYGNSKYWFRRTGGHPAYPSLADRAAKLLESRKAGSLRNELIPHGQWEPFAFVDLCESAARRPASDPQTQLLREIQSLEFRVLLSHLLHEDSGCE